MVLLHLLQPNERTIIESALRDSEERHELLFHCAPGPMLVFDVDSLRILAANGAAVAQYGYTRDELLALTLRDLRAEDSRAAFWRAHTTLRAGREVHGVYTHRRRDQSLLDVEMRTSTLPVGGGRLRLVLVTDITEQKRGADAARFLDKASGILMASLEHDFLCRNLAALAVPALGDWCVVYRRPHAAGIVPCGFTHADPLQHGHVAALVGERAAPAPSDAVCRAWRDAAVIHLTGEAAVAELAGAGNDHALELARLLGARSVLYVPILGRGGNLGVLECVIAGDRRQHDASARALAIALAERAAMAMDNAQRYAELRSTAIARQPSPAESAEARTRTAEQVIENLPDGYLRIDEQWTIVYANGKAEEMLGRPREEIVGHELWSLFPDLVGSEFERAYRRAVAEQRPVMVEEFYPGLDAWFEVSARPAGRGLALFFRDITRHRRALQRMEDSEAQYRDFLENATDLIHMLTPDCRVLFANRAWQDAMGYTMEELSRMTLADVLAPESVTAGVENVRKALRGEPTAEQELVVIRKDGRRMIVRGRTNARFENGRPVSTRSIYRDVTAEVEARALLARAQRTEAASVRAKTAFLDRMSHEMRTPLTAVIGFADILEANRAGRLGDKERDFARRIGAQGRHLLAIIEDVLAYAEIESRRVDLHVARVDLAELVQEVCQLYAPRAAGNGIELTVKLPPETAGIETDRVTLRRVLRYLLNDAVTHERAARVVVTLHVDPVTKRPTDIVVCTAVQGDDRPASAAGVASSLELGLAIAQSLAQVLGYELTFERNGATTTRTLQVGGQVRIANRESDETAKTLHAVLDASPLAIVAFDPDWTVRLWNKAAEQLFGSSAADTIERRLPLLRAEDESAFRELLRTALDEPKGVTDAPFVHRHADGHTVDVRVAIAALRAPDGRLRGFLSIISDVTARQRLEEELRQAQKMEVVGRLAGGIAHDFNNLLTVIDAHSQFLQNDLPRDSDSVADASAIHEAAQRAAALTRQLLAFSRKEVPQRRLVDLNNTLTTTERMLRRILGSHIEFATVPAAEPVLVHADPAQMEQVLMNLVINARDAMPRGGALVVETATCDVRETDPVRAHVPAAGRYALVTVSDTGIGMDAQTRRRIFEPFFTTKGEHRGTGLGLSTVHAIVTESAGGIDVESAPGAGATFRVWLPLAEPDEQMQPVPLSSGVLRGTETILLVEDQDAVRAVAARVLRAYGYTVLSARHGVDALGIVRERGEGIALLLTDLVMAEMPGNELALHVVTEAPHVRVLFMSGYSETPIGLTERDARTPLVRKPFSGEELARAVREVLDAPARPEGREGRP